MDFTDLLRAVPTAGPYFILLLIIAYLGKILLGADKRHTAELDRLTKAHNEEILEVKADVKALREQLKEQSTKYETEVSLRYSIELEAHRLRLENQALKRGRNDNGGEGSTLSP